MKRFFSGLLPFIGRLFNRYAWLKFRTDLSEQERLAFKDCLDQMDERYSFSRSIGIDVLKFYLQTVIAVIIVPMIFQKQLLDIFTPANISNIYIAWACLFVSIACGMLSYFCIFEGYYHLAHFYSFILFRPFLSLERTVREKATNEEKINQAKQYIFLEMSHCLGIAALTFFCVAIYFIVKAIMGLYG
jgi:hypothetical protein